MEDLNIPMKPRAVPKAAVRPNGSKVRGQGKLAVRTFGVEKASGWQIVNENLLPF